MTKTSAIQYTLAIAAAIFAVPACAQTGSTIVKSATLRCSTQAGSGSFSANSWSVGATLNVQQSPAGGTTSSSGRPQLGAFNLVQNFDECSPALFQTLATGAHLQTVTITDPGAAQRAGSSSPLTIQLDNVQVSQYMVGDAASNPGETISLVYERITITNTANGSKFCFDATRNATCN